CDFDLLPNPLPITARAIGERKRRSSRMNVVTRMGQSRFPLKPTLIAAAAIVALSAFLTSTPAYGDATPTPSATSSGPTTAETHAQKVRAEFGLRSDLSYIRSAESEPGTSSRDLGTPLPPAETADIDGRRVLSTWAGTVDTAGESQSDYAGEWIDQQA